ncbi:MAG: cytochrome c biogenesis protein CcsA [Acidobacteriota bacterium]|nr:cytochrome c biogenesis protein CcsA [Acidobacteriota bacterium]
MSTKVEKITLSAPIQSPIALWQTLPTIVAIVAAIALILARYQGSTLNILREGSLTNLALISYIASSLLFGMYLIGREPLMRKMAMFAMGLGFTFNLAAWGVRWIEYVEHLKTQGDMATLWQTLSWTEKVNHTFPLSNLYDITLGLTTFLGLTSMLVGTRKKYEFLGAVTMPLGALFLTLAVFLGNTITTLQPILRSYWRPIHVGVAAISYGICAVTFAVAVLYLLKDNMRIERIALVISVFTVTTYLLLAALFGNFSLIEGSFGMNIVVSSPMGEGPVRFSAARGDFLTANFAIVGRFAQAIVLLSIVAAALYVKDMFFGENDQLRKTANAVFSLAITLQILATGILYFEMKRTKDFSSLVPQTQLPKLAQLMSEQDDPHSHAAQGQIETARRMLAEMSPRMKVSFGSNPVVSAAFFTIIAGGLFFWLFQLRGKSIIENLPPLEVLDDLNYKLVSVCFPGFTLMLILGAVWANESWGSYWSWDPKETWGLITWIAYAAFLHTRFSHGWKGRRSAYFAILGFAFMLFTYLGVSYLLPGLHSYA